MAIRAELHFRLPNSPGSLARVASRLAADQVRILALSLDATGLTRLIVDNPAHAAVSLADEHVAVEQRDVIYTTVAARSVGALLRSAAAAGVNIEYAYASTIDAEGMIALVLGVENAQRASSAAGI
jgi:hypothetical protein